MSLLESINSPEDLSGLSPEDLTQLADEVREFILTSVSQTGGHFGANLGVVELTVALLHLMSPPADRIVWDTTHQTYAHKVLTGRRGDFPTLRMLNGLSGFQSRKESKYDSFGAGHAGTAISAALGMAVARDQRGGDEHVVAVVGDAALGCGISFEALNSVSTTTQRMIIVLNDNEMSISENVGAISKSLGQMLSSSKYNRLKASLESLAKLALRGNWARDVYHKAEEALKGIFLQSPMFEGLGLRYIGPIDGHDLPMLVSALQVAMAYDRPILLHVATTKGKGYRPAEEAPESWHATSGFDIQTGISPTSSGGPLKYQDVFGKVAIRLAEADRRIVCITAGMPTGTGLSAFAKEYPERCFDVGIAEEHAVIFAAGLATDEVVPLVAIYSTFLQRAVDCIIHDVCLQQLPVVFCLDRAGVVGNDGPTHHGVFDIALLRPIPHLTIMQPADEIEMAHMLHTAVTLNAPVVVRYPRGTGKGSVLPEAFETLEIGKAAVVEEGHDVQLWGLGDMLAVAEEAAAALNADGISAGVVNPRFVKPLDRDLLQAQAARAKLFVTIENGVRMGGFGSAVQEELSGLGYEGPVLRFGWPDAYVQHGSATELKEIHGLTGPAVAKAIASALEAEPAG